MLSVTIDSSNTDHLLIVTKDLSQTRMVIAIRQHQTEKTDTLYNNLNGQGVSVKLYFVKILDDKYCVMLTESMFAFSYRYYEWKDSRWQFQHGEVMVWKNREFSTTVEVLDYKNIKVRNGSGDYIFRMDPVNQKMVKEKIETDKH